MTVAVVEDPVGTVTVKSWPVPVSATVCGLAGALSLNKRLPDAGPPAVGVNVTATVQLPDAATGVEVEQVVPALAMAKGPLVPTAVKVRLALPVFVGRRNVSGCHMRAVLRCPWPADRVPA